MPMLKVVGNFTRHDVTQCQSSPTFVMLCMFVGCLFAAS